MLMVQDTASSSKTSYKTQQGYSGAYDLLVNDTARASMLQQFVSNVAFFRNLCVVINAEGNMNNVTFSVKIALRKKRRKAGETGMHLRPQMAKTIRRCTFELKE